MNITKTELVAEMKPGNTDKERKIMQKKEEGLGQ